MVAVWRYVLKLRLDFTGEEDETVEAEVKGVKLFLKRGRKEFTDGMYGHIKILIQKSTPPKSGSENPQGTEAETTPRTRLRKSPPPRTLRRRSLNTASPFCDIASYLRTSLHMVHRTQSSVVIRWDRYR